MADLVPDGIVDKFCLLDLAQLALRLMHDQKESTSRRTGSAMPGPVD